MPRRRSSSSRSVSMPGQRADERRLAVVDVPAVPSVGASCARGRARPRTTTATSSSVSVRAVEQQAPSSMRPITGGSPARSAPRAVAHRSGSEAALDGERGAGSEPPPTRATRVDDLAADGRGQPLGARADVVGGLVRHAQHRDRGAAPAPGRDAAGASPPARRGQLADAHGARQRVAAARGRPPPRVPAMMPLCGPPSSLSPEKQTSVAPAASASCGRRLAGEHRRRRAGPEPRSSSTGTPCSAPSARQRRRGRRLR